MSSMPQQDDKVIAAADLVGRTGATGFEIGYLHDNVPLEQAGWYAHAQFRGARITAEDHAHPADAAEALAVKLLTGAKCKCGRLVALDPDGAIAYRKPVMADGSTFSAADARRAGQCRWRRDGRRWVSGCDGSRPA